MGCPKGGKNRSHSKEEKLELVKRNLAGETAESLERETGIGHSQIHKWTKQYLEGGEGALVNKRKPGNPLAKFTRKKELTPIEQLEYKVALLKRELLKKDGEIVRLKNPSNWKGAMPKESDPTNLCLCGAGKPEALSERPMQTLRSLPIRLLQMVETKEFFESL